METLRLDDIVYDVGANVGAYSLIAGTKLGKAGRVYAFEPAAPSYAALVTNIMANNLAASIIPLPFAFGEKECIDFLGLSSLEPGMASHGMVSSPYPQAVVFLPMDLFIERYKIPVPTMMKIDVDGGEVGVIKGARETLKNPKLREVLIEVRDDKIQERFFIENVMRGAGFMLKEKQILMSSVQGNVWNRLYAR